MTVTYRISASLVLAWVFCIVMLDDARGSGPLDRLQAAAALPDVNGNGTSDFAIFIWENNRVQIRDGGTGDLISAIKFGPHREFQMKVVPDVNGNGAPEIALLQERAGDQTWVLVRDALTGMRQAIVTFGRLSDPQMAVVPDVNGNGTAEIAVSGVDVATGKSRVQLRDSATNEGIRSLYFGTATDPLGVIAMPDQSGNGMPEIVSFLSLHSSGQVVSPMRDSDSAALIRNLFWAGANAPVIDVEIADLDASGADDIVFLSGHGACNELQVRSPATGVAAFRLFAICDDFGNALDAAVIPDIDGDNVLDIAVLVQYVDGPWIDFYSGKTGDHIERLYIYRLTSYGIYRPLVIFVLNDTNGDTRPDLAVFGFDTSTAERTVVTVDPVSGTLINSIAVPVVE